MKKQNLWLLCLSAIIFSACDGASNFVENMEAMEPPGDPATASYEQLLANNCPRVEVVSELASISEFSDPMMPQAENLMSRVQIVSPRAACEYTSKSVTVDLKLTFDAMLGPKGRIQSSDRPFFSYPFFVAVTSPSGKILAKEVFAASLTFNNGQDRQVYIENLRQIIPVKGEANGARHKVMVGFQLSPEQLNYNRAMMKTVQTIQVPDANAAAPAAVPQEQPNQPISLAPPASKPEQP
jgi:hypothetical protein